MGDEQRILTYIVNREEDNLPLRKYLRQKDYSLKMLVHLKKEGLSVNGAFHRLVDPVREGDKIEICCPKEAHTLVPNGALAIPIAYEDDDLIVFDKPKDILIHPAGRGFDDALGNYFAYLFPDKLFRPVGRLDRNTTGLSLSGKHRLIAVALSTSIEKSYYAIVEGEIREDAGTIDAPLLRIPGDKIQRKVDPLGQRAVTHFTVLARLQGHTLLEIKLETGRTHQIRAHFSYLGHPLAGDRLYGGGTSYVDRQALHCGKMEFIHPVTGKTMIITSPLPGDMAVLLEELGR